jgi:DNA-binding response OmpR family regulator
MKKKVLIIEDDHSLLRLSQMILSRKGYVAIPAASSMEAKRMLADDEGPDVIILDLMMPQESGATFLDWLLEQPSPLCDTPVILNTAKTLTREEIDEFSRKCRKIILKGIDFTETLLAEVEAALKD